MPPLLPPRLWAQIRKEMLCLLRDPKSRFLIIGPPLIQLLVFSFAATLEVRNVDLAVLDRDAGRWGFELVQRVGAASFLGRLHRVHDARAIQGLLDRREVLAAIDIPETFSRDIGASRPATVRVTLDGRRANAAQIVLSYLNEVMAGLNAEREGRPVAADRVAIRHAFNPNLDQTWFVVPGLGGVLVMLVTLLITSLSVARERELGTFDQLLVSPCSPTEIIVAKLVPALIIGTALGLLMAGAGILGFRVPFTGSLAWLLASLVLYIASIIGIGLMISSVCATQQQAILGAFAVAVPAVLLSGFSTPVENMPAALQWLSLCIPLTHYLIILHGSFLKSMPPGELLAHAWPMAVIALVTLSTATLFVRGKLR